MSTTALIGHAHLQELLARSVVRNRVPQTLLLAGPSGVGKATAARALAQAVNCATASGPGGSGVACGRCSSCDRIARGQFSDVIVLDRGDLASIAIRPVRERVLDLVGYRPFEGRKRVFIIDGADDLTLQAQDALLKTLEEPPPSAILMLVTAWPDALRATVLSRCRRLRFGALSDTDVARVLVERLGMDAAAARSRAAIAGGSVGTALAIDGGSLEADRELAMELLEASAGTPLVPRLKAAAALTVHEKKRRSREAVGSRLALVSSLLRDLAAAQSDGVAELTHADMAEALTRLQRAWPLPRIVAAFGVVARAQHALDRNASPKIVADWVAAGL